MPAKGSTVGDLRTVSDSVRDDRRRDPSTLTTARQTEGGKRRKRLPVDIFGQDGSENGLAAGSWDRTIAVFLIWTCWSATDEEREALTVLLGDSNGPR